MKIRREELELDHDRVSMSPKGYDAGIASPPCADSLPSPISKAAVSTVSTGSGGPSWMR